MHAIWLKKTQTPPKIVLNKNTEDNLTKSDRNLTGPNRQDCQTLTQDKTQGQDKGPRSSAE